MPIIEDFFKNNIGKSYSIKEATMSMGVHRYDPNVDGNGLDEHQDVGIVSIIYSDKPLEGFIDGEWKTIEIPEDHVMVFTGLTTAILNNKCALLHRVIQQTQEKFTIGAFIGANPNAKLVKSPDAIVPDDIDTVEQLTTSYFNGKFKWKIA